MRERPGGRARKPAARHRRPPEPIDAGPGPVGTDTDAPLLTRASKAFAWSFLNTVASRLGTLGIGIALARLLGPEQFGTYAVGLVALTAVLSFNELGVSLAIVRWPGDPQLIAPTVNTVSTTGSVVLASVSWLLAPEFAAAMGDPAATPVVRLLALTVIVSGAVAGPVALLQRGFRQDKKFVIDQVNTWLGAIISVGLVLAGAGAVSLAIGRLAGSVVAGVMFVRAADGPYRFGWRREQVRPLLDFGLPLAGASIVVFLVGYIDQLIVGQALGSVALGVYVLATNLSNWPVQIFSAPLRSVAPAAFARIRGDERSMRSTLLSLAGLLSAVTLPVCAVAAGAAEPLISFVYGDAWSAAAAPLSWLAALAALRIFYELAYDYFVVRGSSRAVFALQLVWLAALVPALVWGAKAWGLAGVGAAQVAVAAGLMLPLYLWQFRRTGIRTTQLARRVTAPLLVAGVVAALAAGLGRGLTSDPTVLLLAGLATALAVVALVFRDRGQLRRLRGTPMPSAAVGS